MSVCLGNAVVGQSGGPTAAINATLAGVLRGAHEAIREGRIGKVYGMRYGIEGFMKGHLTDMSALTEEELTLLERTPAAALGSCRFRLGASDAKHEDYEAILNVLRAENIRYFFYIGGNDSMDTVLKLSRYAKEVGYELHVIGVPKTIDNDLVCTDHTPGFGSAAKYIATSVKEMLRDIAVYTVKAVAIVEIMGRDAGWLTSAAALAGISDGIGPDLIYLPEHPFSTEAFLADIRRIQKTQPAVLVAVSEGIRFADGTYVSAGTASTAKDVFGHTYLAGAARALERIVKEEIGCKVRSVELNLPQRCAAHLSSRTDIEESVMIGKAAVREALAGASGIMMTFRRTADEPYGVTVESEDISGIANSVRAVPREYINEQGNGVTEACLAYLRPLIVGEVRPVYENGVPKHFVLPR